MKKWLRSDKIDFLLICLVLFVGRLVGCCSVILELMDMKKSPRPRRSPVTSMGIVLAAPLGVGIWLGIGLMAGFVASRQPDLFFVMFLIMGLVGFLVYGFVENLAQWIDGDDQG